MLFVLDLNVRNWSGNKGEANYKDKKRKDKLSKLFTRVMTVHQESVCGFVTAWISDSLCYFSQGFIGSPE